MLNYWRFLSRLSGRPCRERSHSLVLHVQGSSLEPPYPRQQPALSIASPQSRICTQILCWDTKMGQKCQRLALQTSPTFAETRHAGLGEVSSRSHNISPQ